MAGLGFEVGVRVEDDAAHVLSTRSADIAVIAVSSYMADQYEHLRLCAEHGVNAVTLSEEALYPWRTSPAMTAELDLIAKRTGVTLTGTGHQDSYWVNLVAMMMGTAHRLRPSPARPAGTSTTTAPRSRTTSASATPRRSSPPGWPAQSARRPSAATCLTPYWPTPA